jgi:hypothetical protein
MHKVGFPALMLLDNVAATMDAYMGKPKNGYLFDKDDNGSIDFTSKGEPIGISMDYSSKWLSDGLVDIDGDNKADLTPAAGVPVGTTGATIRILGDLVAGHITLNPSGDVYNIIDPDAFFEKVTFKLTGWTATGGLDSDRSGTTEWFTG